MTAVLAAETLVLIVLTVLVAGLLRSHATILRRLHELDGGTEPRGTAPQEFRTVPEVPSPVRLPDPTGPARDLQGRVPDAAGGIDNETLIRIAGVEQDTVLLFLSSGCSTCQNFWSDLARPGGVALPADTRLIVVTKDSDEESPALLNELRPAGIDLVMSGAAWTDYRVPGTPYVVAVDGPSGRITGEGTGLGWDQVARLLAESTGDAAYTGRARRGATKPETDAAREARADRELLAAGIAPGDASLYPDADRSA